MANPNLPVVNPMSLWGTILSGAQQGLDSQSMYASINSQLEASGARYGATTLPDVAKLWGRARAMTNASNNLASAPEGYAIDSSMIGVVPYGQTAQGRYGAPRYNVRTTYQTMEGDKLIWRSFVTEGIDPSTMTVGELRAQAYADAADAAAGYEGGMVGEPTISIEQM